MYNRIRHRATPAPAYQSLTPHQEHYLKLDDYARTGFYAPSLIETATDRQPAAIGIRGFAPRPSRESPLSLASSRQPLNRGNVASTLRSFDEF